MANIQLSIKSTCNKILFIMLFCLAGNAVKAQVLSLDELFTYQLLSSEKVEERLTDKGWTSYNVSFITDSNLVKKTWVINNKYNDLKSYFQFYEFTKDPNENYIIYQFSERKTFNAYQDELKKLGFKDPNAKSKKKKKKKGDPNLYKEKDVLFVSDRKNTLVMLKEVFVYGMNAFVVYVYRGDSQSAKDLSALEKSNAEN